MTREGKAPLDSGQRADSPARPAAYAALERRSGATVGAKEMAMTRRPRAEDGGRRAERFLRIDRAGGAD